MRTYSTTSDGSIISSIDDLSISSPPSTSPRVSHAESSNRPRGSLSSEEDYEIILVPSPEQRRASSSASSGVLINHTDAIGPSHKAVEIDSPTKGKAMGKDKSKAKMKARSALPEHSSDQSDTSTDTTSSKSRKAQSRRTRRGGMKTRARKERAEVRKVLDLDGIMTETETPTASPSRHPSPQHTYRSDTPADEYSDHGASRYLDEEEDEEQDEDEVDDLSVLAADSDGEELFPKQSRGTKSSVMSTEDAKSSIDSFLSGDIEFMSDKANKLRLWQALSIEFGLVATPTDLPDLPIAPPATISAIPIAQTAHHPLPQTITSAQRLLKNHAHVNLADYLDARRSGETDFNHLLYPSANKMIRATKREGKFVKLPQAKGEWLQPLLKDFGFKRYRSSA